MSDAPRIRRNSASTGAQKWVALVSAPVFFLIAGTLANGGLETVSTVFALLAMAMPLVFVVLAIRDWVWAMRSYRARQTAIPEESPRSAATTSEPELP
ncbi:hypothetical protein [Magnetospirillum fulvum]|uniref:Uncharacterized protein n=1 Tax=Magnetospirillum fulvum TaxID=1082 RepID=A0A1H6HPK6_MAGFU|nr:hypothetical protein [Magnetospirillum fulvum]SEH35933.1 hypothetical protein SAMN04244559_01867 [Magnetospirillum fulvum]